MRGAVVEEEEVAITEEEGDEEEEEGMKANRAEGTAPRGVVFRTMICCSGCCWAVVVEVFRMMIGFIGTPVLALTSIGAAVDKEEEEGVVEITVGVIEVVAEVETTVVATITWLAVPAAVVVVVVMESGAFMILMVMTFLPLTRVAPLTGRAPLAVERLTVCS